MAKARKIKAITNCQLVLENGVLWDAALIISEGKIIDYSTMREITIPEGTEIIDAGIVISLIVL